MEIINKDLLHKLVRSGFTEKESLVYISVLELKGGFPSRIAKYCGLRRSTVYNILTTLSVRGIINEIEKKNKIFYQIENPGKIQRYVDNKAEETKNMIENLNKVMPEIFNIYNLGSDNPKITYYTGNEGVMSIYEDMVAGNKPYEMVAFTNAGKFADFIEKNGPNKYLRAKERIGITSRGILPEGEEDRSFIEKIYKDINKKYWPQFRYVEKSVFPFATEITMYSTNKVAIINLEEKHLSGVIIEDRAIHTMMKAAFELAWESRRVKE